MLILAIALAAPPEGIDPDDFGHWESAADRALDGPAGCWDLTGALRVDAGMHTSGTALFRNDTLRMDASGTWEGRLEDGQWSSFVYQWTETGEGTLDVAVFPVIGRIDQDVVVNATPGAKPKEPADDDSVELSLEGDDASLRANAGGQQAINLFQKVVDSWEPAGSTTVSEWSDELGAIRLLQDIPLLDKVNPPVVTVTSVFPGGQEHPTQIDAVFPKRIKMGEFPMKVTLMDTRFHLRQMPVGDHVLPQVEGFTVLAGFWGFTFGYEQQIAYGTATPCTSEG